MGMAKFTFFVLVAVAAAGPSTIGLAQSAKKIGVANTVVRSVSGEIDRRRQLIAAGDQVFQGEIIRTEPRAATRIIFNDETSLAIGSKSVVTLDEFVYRPDASSSRIVFSTARGALRFITGKARSSAYRINTPTATIGVRGTDFDVYIDRYKSTLVLLRGGNVRVCRKGVKNIWKASPHCRDLIAPRTFVLITTGFIAGPFIWDDRSPMDILYDNRPNSGGQGGNDNGEPDNGGGGQQGGGEQNGSYTPG